MCPVSLFEEHVECEGSAGPERQGDIAHHGVQVVFFKDVIEAVEGGDGAIEALGFRPVGAPPDVFAKQLTNESATWREVIRASGLKMR